ncbi:hypothetical protein Mtc_2224 [Methanocella conradii HZ254]|uniref:Methyltransferase domain-containing protein n=2 Tax=Methanocella TaxID=570266 RepID=H8I9Z9_METCZ|nr:hypothetical protein Mtc_2224 [Methanocella conradii HZ254]
MYKMVGANLSRMLLQKMLGFREDAYLIESSFEGLEVDLKTLDYLDKLGMLPDKSIDSAVRIFDKEGSSIGVAFKNKYEGGDFWFVIPYPSARAARQQTERLVNHVLDGGIVASVKKKRVASLEFKRAIREYLALSLAEGALCECDKEKEPRSFAYNEGRNKRLRSLLERLAGEHGLKLGEMEALEICCGNGMSTTAIKPLFKGVLSIDNDKCEVCNGVYHGTLEPADVMVIDAMRLTDYVHEKYDAVLGFMLGTIYEFNKGIWRMVFEESVKALKDDGFLLLTVNTREEMGFVAGVFKSMGIKGEVIDNQSKDDIYDGWAFFAIK